MERGTYFVPVHCTDSVPLGRLPNARPSVPILQQFLGGMSQKTSQRSPCAYHSSTPPPGNASKIGYLFNNSKMRLMIKQDNKLKRTKAYNLTEVPTIPLVIQRVVPCTWRHLSHTRRKCISRRPGGLYFFSARPPSPSCITQTKILSTPLSVSVNMPARDSNVNLNCWVDLHVLREVGHATAKVLRPLTADVVCDKNPWECYTDKRRKDNKIHIRIPNDRRISCRMIF
jgi:hypothetical protein